jgi:hypothetical protein
MIRKGRTGLAAVLIGGPPATGKSTLAMALAPHLDAAVLDLDTATAPLTRVVSVVLVAPFSAERARPSAWAATTRRIPAEATMVWLHLPPAELIRRLALRGLARDENKIRDPASYLTGLDLEPPAIPHLALDASQPTEALVRSLLDHLAH